MNGPSPGYLGDIMASMPGGLTATPVGAPANPFGLNLGNPQPVALPPPPAPATAPAGPPEAPPAPGQIMSGGGPPGPLMSSAPVGAPAPAQPPPPDVSGPQFPLRQVGGPGVANIPAKETELRGPHLLAAQDQRNVAEANTIDHVAQRNAQAAEVDYGMALDQARQAQVHQEAADQAGAERAQELQQRQQEFDSSVKALSKMSVDPDRFWASRSTGQKVSAMVSIALGGFLQGARGGSNMGLDMINSQIDRDLKAQEFAYNASRDTANAKQTAFGLAMQKYGSVDAARAAARAAALDTVQAQMAQSAAMWKGTDAANRADMAIASLQDEKMKQIAQGIMFAPSRQVAVGPRWVDPHTGISYDEKQAQEVSKEYRGYGFDIGKEGAKTYGQAVLEGIKGEQKQGDKADEGASKIAAAVQSTGVPKARALAEGARESLVNSPVGVTERLFENPTVHKALYGQQAAEREQSWTAFKSETLHALSGAAISPTEQARFDKQLEGAKDTASRLKAIRDVQATLDAQERTAMANGDPRAQAAYMRNKSAAQTSGPGAMSGIQSFKPAGK